MYFLDFLGLGQTALELALFNSLTVLALYLSYSMLNVCDLSTDGCYTLGAAVGAMVALEGYPLLSIPAAMLAGMDSQGCPAMATTAPTAAPNVKQPSVDRSQTFSIE